MGCFGWLAVLGSAVVAWLLWRSHARGVELGRRLGVLELQIGELQSRLARGLAAESVPPTESVVQEPEAAPLRALDSQQPPASELGMEGGRELAPPATVTAAPTGQPPGPASEAFSESVSDSGSATTAEPVSSPPSEPSATSPDSSLPPPPPSTPSAWTSEPPPSQPPRARINWEQWIGVRGAALLGGIVLALAGIYFVRYSIEAGWVPPVVRIAIGILTGIAAILGGEALRKRDYTVTANGLAGAGVVILYAAIWAGRALYSLFGSGVAGALLALVTVAGGVLSWRYRSRVIAILGLVGGFATPLLISSGSDRPIGLFGYLLLLNVGTAFLSRRTGWSILGALALGGTVLYQALWIFARMDAERTWLGLLILGVFVLFYAAVGWLQRRDHGAESGNERERSPLEILQQAGAVLTPFAFALYFAAQSDLGEHLWPTAMLLLLLNLAAVFVSRVHDLPFIGPAAASASLGIVFVWSLRTEFNAAFTWELLAVLLGLAVLHHLTLELRLRPRGRENGSWRAFWGEAAASAVTAGGALFWLLLIWVALPKSGEPSPFWIAFGGAVLSALLLIRQSKITRLMAPGIGAATGLGLHLFAAILVALSPDPGQASFSVALLLSLAAGASFQAWVLWQRNQPAKQPQERAGEWPERGHEAGAVVVPGLALLALLFWASLADDSARSDHLALFHGGSLMLALLIILSATRIRSGLLYGAAMAMLALVQLVWTGNGNEQSEGALEALGLQLLAVGVFSYWPLVARLATAGTRRAAALAGPAWFLSLHSLYVESWGQGAIGLLPIVLGVLSLFAGYGRVRLDAREGARSESEDALARPETTSREHRRSTLAWYGGVTLGFVALAIPLQLDREWITVAWALQALAMTALWKRVDHPGLKYFGLALHMTVALRLIANPALFDYYPTGSEPFGLPVLNWLLYTYLVPVAALVLSSRILEPLEIPRIRSSEHSLYRPFGQRAVISALYGLTAIAVAFVWINLTIFDAFAPGSPLAISFDRQPARDLVLSLSWAMFALGLLMLGVGRKSVALRWISLVFFLLTIAKVFLYDLGELKDLFRVASLVGLALSLIVVSLLYQRFVFGRDGRKPDEASSAEDASSP